MKTFLGWICKLYAVLLSHRKFTSGDMIRLARCLLVIRGWCQNEMFDSKGRMCTIGALVTARDMLNNERIYSDALQTVQLALHDRREFHGISYWNDRVASSKQDVVEVLTAAAKKADAASQSA